MSHDLYASWSGAQAAWRQLEIVSGNIANASTPGYREQRATFELAGSEGPLGDASTRLQGIGYSKADGELVEDGVATHLALRGDGFFALADGTYTRDGGFQLDPDGRLVTSHGTPVLTDAGPVQLQPGEAMSIDTDGTVRGAQSGELGKLSIVQLQGGQPVGGNLWSGTSGGTSAATVVQGAREGSNADPMRGMVDLIEASRFFEAQQKAMQTSDDMRERLDRMQG
jgi:flagellar basal body rod protein FlgG